MSLTYFDQVNLKAEAKKAQERQDVAAVDRPGLEPLKGSTVMIAAIGAVGGVGSLGGMSALMSFARPGTIGAGVIGGTRTLPRRVLTQPVKAAPMPSTLVDISIAGRTAASIDHEQAVAWDAIKLSEAAANEIRAIHAKASISAEPGIASASATSTVIADAAAASMGPPVGSAPEKVVASVLLALLMVYQGHQPAVEALSAQVSAL